MTFDLILNLGGIMDKYWVDGPFELDMAVIKNGVKIVSLEDAVKELNSLKEWQEKAFEAHPNIDIDIENLKI